VCKDCKSAKTYPQIAPVALDLVSIPASQACWKSTFAMWWFVC